MLNASIAGSPTVLKEENPAPPTAKGAPRLHFVDGLRACAMLFVLLDHCWFYGHQWVIGFSLGHRHINVASVFGYGHIGVNLFLVLSGFCLYWPFVKAGARQEPTLWEFAKRRCRRILPPYYVALALFGGIPLAISLVEHSGLTSESWFLVKSIGWHLVMLHNLRPDYIMSIDSPFWSLGLESQLYVLFPLFVECYRRFNARGVLFGVFVLVTCYRVAVAYGGYPQNDDIQDVLAGSVFGRCFEFALGMYAAKLVAQGWGSDKPVFKPIDYAFAAAVVGYAVIDGRHSHFQPLTDAMWGLLAAGALVFASRSGSRLHAFLSKPWLVTCGIFSYSVYLVHIPLVKGLNALATAWHFNNLEVVAFQFFCVIPTAIGIGYLFHLLFEKPFMGPPKPSQRNVIQAAAANPETTSGPVLANSPTASH